MRRHPSPSRRRVAALLCLAALLAPAGAAGAARPVGPALGDGRVVVPEGVPPWSAVGRLNVAGFRERRHCTATLVAPDVALTALHCLRAFGYGAVGVVEPSEVHFLPGYARGRFADHLRGVAFEPIGAEAVLVRLDHRSSVPPLPIDPAPVAPGAPLYQAGYSADRGQVLTVDPLCTRLPPPSGPWRHDCVAVHGDSGGPILHDTPDGPAMVAVHVGNAVDAGIAEPLAGRALLGITDRP